MECDLTEIWSSYPEGDTFTNRVASERPGNGMVLLYAVSWETGIKSDWFLVCVCWKLFSDSNIILTSLAKEMCSLSKHRLDLYH